MTNKEIRELVESVKITNSFDRVDSRVYRLQSYISQLEDNTKVLVYVLLKDWKALAIATATATQSTIQKSPLTYHFRNIITKNEKTIKDYQMVDKFTKAITPKHTLPRVYTITTERAIDMRKYLDSHKVLSLYNI